MTLKEIAALAGVSKMTVSRVLRGNGAFSADARSRVEKAVRQTGYVPNRIAGSLASARSTLVAVIVPTIGNIVFTEVLAGISQVLTPSGLQAVLGVTDYDMAREEALVETMLSWRPRAIIIAGLEHTPKTRKRLRNAGIPVVQIMDIDGPVIDMAVGFSQTRAGAAVAEHFLARGYSRIAYAGVDLSLDTRARKRFHGFVSELAKSGLSVAADRREPLPTSFEGGAAALVALMRTTPGVQAIYFANDDMAVGAILHCLKHGVAVPGQIAAAGFNGLGLGQSLPIALTSVRSPRIEAGQTAARQIVRRLKDDRTQRIIDLGFEFLPGQSS